MSYVGAGRKLGRSENSAVVAAQASPTVRIGVTIIATVGARVQASDLRVHATEPTSQSEVWWNPRSRCSEN